MRRIAVGDIVCFKKIRKINLSDLIARKNYSKYMLVVDIIIDNTNPKEEKIACKVLCANGEINWVGSNSIEIINLS